MKKYTFTINGNKYEVSITDTQNNVIDLQVNGTPYSVELEQEVLTPKTPTIVRQTSERKPEDTLLKKPISPSPEGVSQLESPLPGNISEILVKKGDRILRGQTLIIMESMKMQNNILAEKDGTVKEIKVSVGQAVLQGDPLIELE